MSLYRSPDQSSDEFTNFKQNLDNTLSKIELENPHIIVLLDNFNGRCSSWWPDDIDNRWGVEIHTITTFHSLCQLIDCLTHIFPNSSSCIDLIFSS